MFEWLKKLGAKNATPPSEYPDAEIAHLAADFDRLPSGYRDRVIRYVTTGSDSGVLAELARDSAKAAAALRLSRRLGSRGEARDRRHFFRTTTIRDAAFFARLASVYHAVCSADWKTFFLPMGAIGLDPFLGEATLSDYHYYGPIFTEKARFPSSIVEEMLAQAGDNPEKVARVALLSDVKNYDAVFVVRAVLALDGIGETLDRHPAVVIEGLTHKDFNVRVHTLDVMTRKHVAVAPFVEQLAALAVGNSKQARQRAEILLRDAREAGTTELETHLAGGAPDARARAAQLLWAIRGEEARTLLEAMLEKESARSVREALESLLHPADSEAPAAEPIAPLSFPPVAMRDERLDDSARVKVMEILERGFIESRTYYDANKNDHRWLQSPERLDEAQKRKLWEALQPSPQPVESFELPVWIQWEVGGMEPPAQRIVRLREIGLPHAVRLVRVVTSFQTERRGIFWRPIDYRGMQILSAAFRARPYTTRELGEAFRKAHADPRLILEALLLENPLTAREEWAGENPWELFAEYPEKFDEVFGPSSTIGLDYEQNDRRRNALNVLGRFPSLPPTLLRRAWDIAVTGNKVERPLAQQALAKEPNCVERLVAALKESRPETRVNAIEWLGRIGDASAIAPIRALLPKERSELVRGAAMVALERLGVSMEEFLDVKSLASEAARGLKGGTPAALEWFPFKTLPAVRWRESGEVIDGEIIRWFVVQAFKSKSAEPSPLLRQYASYFHAADREALGAYVLESWVAQDTSPRFTPEEADAMAQKQAAQSYNAYKKYYDDSGTTQDQVYRTYYNSFLNTCVRSAIKEKGILAIAGACGGASCVAVVARYLKKWYGQRAAQCKALLEMLTWIDDPSAIQLLLATANRFRTKGIREAAEIHVREIAERKGWTLDELSDRTIPGIGFEDKPEMVIDYGARKFVVRLDKEFDFVITNEEGKVVKSLPEARKDEDAEQVKEAKKTFADAKKQLKPMLAAQKVRLYEAMCVQRVWRFGDWDTYLNRHPIISRYCQSLVWEVVEDGRAISSFRPLEDRTLTNARDEEVTLDENASIRLAHTCTTSPEDIDAWHRHFADYEVTPLFEQFRSEQFSMPDDEAVVEVKDFEGWILEAFKLRGRATKLGFTRGEAQDGGWFYEYKKLFPGAGYEAILEFTGNTLPEENRTVALVGIHFTRSTAQARTSAKLPIRRVPAVLVSETWNDVKTIAAQGPGFDPNWRKKTEF